MEESAREQTSQTSVELTSGSGELTDKLVISPEHTTAYARYYSGNFKPFIRHFEGERSGGWITHPYDFIDINTLKDFLVSEILVSGEEFPLDRGTNGSKFWLFSPDVAKHKQKLDEKVSKSNGFFIYVPDEPLLIGGQDSQDECGLVTSAYIVEANKLNENCGKMAGTWNYTSTYPEAFNDHKFLKVKTMVQIKSNALVKHTCKTIPVSIKNDYVNLVLTDLRRGLTDGSTDNNTNPLITNNTDNELTQMYAGVGGDSYCGVGFVTLRTANYETYRFAQANMLSVLKIVLDDPSVIDMLQIQQEIGVLREVSYNYGQKKHDKYSVRADILEAHRLANEKLVDQLYKPHLKSAVEKLGQHEEVVKVLRLM